jgi:hypothetical protein
VSKPPKWIGFAVYAEVDDPDKAKSMLHSMATKAKLFGKAVKRDRAAGGFSFEIPDWRRVHVGVGGKYVVVSTDVELAGRMAKGKAGTIEQKASPASGYAAMKLPDTALTYAADMATFGWLTFGTMGSFESVAMAEPPEVADIPKSRNWNKKQKELEALDNKLNAQRSKAEAGRADNILDMIRPMGLSVFAIRVEDRDLWATGGQFVRAESIPAAIEAVTQNARGLFGATPAEPTPEREKLFELQEQRNQLQSELDHIRQQDIERFQSRKKR